MELSVVIPAYLEAENLRTLLPELTQVLRGIASDFEVLVVDTAEPMDETEGICDRWGVRCVRREGGNAYGDAIRTGFAKAAGTYVAVMDADGSHDPKDLTRFYQEMTGGEDFDLIIGSRYCKGGSTDNPLPLILMSLALNISYRLLFGLKVRDVSDSYRLYQGDQVRALHLRCDNFDIVEEILIALKYAVPDFSAKEVPIRFRKRGAGDSKRKLGRFILTYLQTMHRLLGIKRSLRREQGKETTP